MAKKDEKPQEPKDPIEETLGREQLPSDLGKPSDTDDVTEGDDAGRPTAREGLKPVGRERPHPTAAARVAKTYGQVLGSPAAAPPAPAKEQGKPDTIRVEALQLGYYDNVRRRAGDVFDVKPDDYSERWMRAVSGDAPLKTTTSKESLEAEQNRLKREKREQQLYGNPPGREGATGDQRPIGD